MLLKTLESFKDAAQYGGHMPVILALRSRGSRARSSRLAWVPEEPVLEKGVSKK